jgi:hypothetical protein
MVAGIEARCAAEDERRAGMSPVELLADAEAELATAIREDQEEAARSATYCATCPCRLDLNVGKVRIRVAELRVAEVKALLVRT